MKNNPRAIELDLTDLRDPLAANVLRWQSLWVGLVEGAWRTLAVVPVGHESLASDVTVRLVQTAQAMGQTAFHVREPVESWTGEGHCLLSTASPLLFPEAALMARTADAVILVVALERDTVAQVLCVRNMVGTQRILGCVVAGRGKTKGARHGIRTQRGDGNVQPANVVGEIVGRPGPAAVAARNV
jgi:hypothetical protein